MNGGTRNEPADPQKVMIMAVALFGVLLSTSVFILAVGAGHILEATVDRLTHHHPPGHR